MVRGSFYGYAEDLDSPERYDEIANCTLMKVEAQVDQLFSSIVRSMNDLFCPNTTLDDTPNGASLYGQTVTLSNGRTITLDADTPVLDEANCPVGVDGELPPRELFVRAGCERYTKFESGGNTYYIYNAEVPDDTSTYYSIGNVRTNEELEKQITLMPAYKNDGVFEQVDYGMGAKISAAWAHQGMKLNPYDAKPCSFEEYYDRVIGELGIEGNTYKSATETMEDAVASIDSKRQMVTGVSSDEELTQMIKYQAAYNAASRFITVISQMTELIVTGLK